MSKVILITGASSGFGALTARALASAGHTVFATMLHPSTVNAPAVADLDAYAFAHNVSLHAVELDVLDPSTISAAIAHILAATGGRLDCIVHNAGHMCLGPTEAFTPEQLASYFDINVIGTHRVNRAALPHMRRAGQGHIIWVGSSSTSGGIIPFLGPYFAAKAAMDSLAVSYAMEVSKWGVETTVVVPGAFTSGTNHFQNAGKPGDTAVEEEYYQGPYEGLLGKALDGLRGTIPPDADVAAVAGAIVEAVGKPRGKKPFRVHVDFAGDGSVAADAVKDFAWEQMLRRTRLEDLTTVKLT